MAITSPAKKVTETGFLYDQDLESKGEEMPERVLRSIVEEEIRSSVGFVGGDVSEERRRAMDYYLGDPFGNEQEDRSQVVSTDVQDTIESVMPEMMEIFAAGDKVVTFKPVGPEDVDTAQQATDYCNYIWQQDNPGFEITHDWVKDGLLQKNGMIKIYWEENVESKRETLERINSLALQELMNDPEVEIVEHEEYPVEDMAVLPYAPDGILHDLSLIRTRKNGKVTIDPVPPEEFLIARRAVSLDREAPFTCHKTKKTASDLLRMGYDAETVNSIPSHDDQDYNEERVSRFDDDEWPELDDSLDPSMREIWLYECYLKVDFDGDGIAEMRQVTVAGPGYKVLENEPVDDHPFAFLTPIKMPHKFFGRSLADLTMDVQLIKSTIQRQLLDNMYLVNNARTAIGNKVDIDDFLVRRPGGAVRVDTDQADVGGHLVEMQTSPLSHHAFPLLEYFDTIRESRTGVTRLGQGLDPDALNSTARGMNMMLGRTQKRLLLIARTMAELGFRVAFRKILKLVVNRQDRARVIRLRNEWVEIDPRSWNAEMDVTISVGLGYGTKEDQTLMLERLLMKQMEIVQMQGGVQGPLVGLKEAYNTLEKWVNAMGIRDVASHFRDPPEDYQPPEPPPDPKMIEVQQKGQLEGQKLQLESQKLQLEGQKLQLEAQSAQAEQAQKDEELRLKWAELEFQNAVDIDKVGIERDKTALEIARLETDADLKHGEQELKRDESEERKTKTAESAEAMVKSAKDILKKAGDYKKVQARLDEAEKRSKEPKKVKIIRKGGKIVGAEVEQGGQKTKVGLE